MIVVNLFVKKKHAAGLLSTVLIALFHSYGASYKSLIIYLLQFSDDASLNQHSKLSLAWVILIIVSSMAISRVNVVQEVSRFLTIVSVMLVIFAISGVVTFEVERANVTKIHTARIADLEQPAPPEVLPDIYYIVLDAHAREDVYLNVYGYDNSDFTDQLDALGFYVGECSQSNYWRTEFSLGTALNMQYVGTLFENPETQPTWANSTVKQILDSMGYTSIAFGPYGVRDNNQDIGADIELTRDGNSDDSDTIYLLDDLNYYEIGFVETTWLQAWAILLADASNYLSANTALEIRTVSFTPEIKHYRDVHFILDELKSVPLMEGAPKFVFAHLLVPHFPYIFAPDGAFEFHDQYNDNKAGYISNTKFIDSQIPDILNAILEQSETPPIIIVQGDHAMHDVDPNAVMPILNAYYLPEGDGGMLYESISPVNTFRVIFNRYFSTNYPMLDDESYYVDAKTFENLELVPNLCKPGGKNE